MILRLRQISGTLFYLAWSGFCFWTAIRGLVSGTVLAPSKGIHNFQGYHAYLYRASDSGWFWAYEIFWVVLGAVYPALFFSMGKLMRPFPTPVSKETSQKQYESKKRRMINKRKNKH